MASKNLETWNRLKQPPKWALKQIQAGRLKGKSDISPQWRYQAMTEVYGPCGIGWTYTIDQLWTEPGPDDQVFAFARISLWVKQNGEWSSPIPGIGGHMLIVKEKSGPHANDEAYKMAVTDALSTALKMLGVAADVYAGMWDGAKYAEAGPATPDPDAVTKDQLTKLATVMGKLGISSREAKLQQVNTWLQNQGQPQVASSWGLTKDQAGRIIDELEQELQQPQEATA